MSETPSSFKAVIVMTTSGAVGFRRSVAKENCAATSLNSSLAARLAPQQTREQTVVDGVGIRAMPRGPSSGARKASP